MQLTSASHALTGLVEQKIVTSLLPLQHPQPLSFAPIVDGFIRSKSATTSALSRTPEPLYEYTNLHDAVERCSLEDVKQLLKSEGRKALNMQDENGYTPLHIAAEQGYAELVEFLLGTHGIQTNLRTANGETAVQLARISRDETGDPTSLRLLRSGRTTLHHATNAGRLDEMHHILRNSNVDMLNATDRFGNTALHLAARNGDLNAVRVLTGRSGIDLRARNYNQQTAFQLARHAEEWDVVSYLRKRIGITGPIRKMRTGGFFYKRSRV